MTSEVLPEPVEPITPIELPRFILRSILCSDSSLPLYDRHALSNSTEYSLFSLPSVTVPGTVPGSISSTD